jgi:hypothetical protein
MSVDPAAAAGSSGAAGVDALIAAELNALAADAQALQQQVSVGDVVSATVLPSNGLSDLLNILGNRVAAALPPTLVPGDVITAQVTGFNGTQILLQILATNQPSSTSSGTGVATSPNLSGLPSATSTASPPAAASTPAAPPPATAGPAPAPPPPGGSLAPPVAVFVAGTVRPNAPTPLPIPPGGTVAEPAPGEAPGTIPGAAGTTLVTPAFGGIEARLAAARAAAVTVVAPSAGRAASAPAAAPAPSALSSPSAPPPQIAPNGASLRTASPAPSAPASAASAQPAANAAAQVAANRPFVPPPTITASRFVDGATAAANAANADAPARSLAIYQDPVNLVRALQLPVTPTNVAAAQLALSSPQRLPVALATLESALPQSDDPRVATYRAIAAFVAKIEPASPQLATQIAAYVEHVVAGSEPALAQLLVAHATADAATVATTPAQSAAADAADPNAEPAAAAANAPAAAANAAKAAVAEATTPSLALAQIVERGANIASSLKEQLFSLLAGAPANAGDDVVPAAASALTAVTAVQMSAAQAAAAAPATISFAIPMYLGAAGYAQAQVAVDRDAPDTPNVPLDGDNFHIAFILDTKNLGTVAIDLRTVGRAFSLSVKTENVRSAQRFGDELSRLTDRLSTLRYQPKSVEAIVASPTAPPTATIAPVVATDSTPAPLETGLNERA